MQRTKHVLSLFNKRLTHISCYSTMQKLPLRAPVPTSVQQFTKSSSTKSGMPTRTRIAWRRHLPFDPQHTKLASIDTASTATVTAIITLQHYAWTAAELRVEDMGAIENSNHAFEMATLIFLSRSKRVDDDRCWCSFVQQIINSCQSTWRCRYFTAITVLLEIACVRYCVDISIDRTVLHNILLKRVP